MIPKVLEGRVAIVTGSSRGIGRALALRLAQEGARVVVTGKSETSTERLPGSMHSVVEEVRALGGETLPVRMDVRREGDVEGMVKNTIQAFGRLDVLVNNASALWWESVLKTPPKRYDLMWEVNTRGTYLCCYHALPHLIKNGWGHVVTMSPPISADPSPGRVAYATTKMGMTCVALGVATEHKEDNVASNALWPATLIESQATIHWGMEGAAAGARRRYCATLRLRSSRTSRRRSRADSSWTRSSCASGAGPRRNSTPIGSVEPRLRILSG